MGKVDIEKLEAKSGFQLINYMKKRGVSSFPEEIHNYYLYRYDILASEYRIRH